METYENKRASHRDVFLATLVYVPEAEGVNPGIALSTNISAGGMGIVAPHYLKPGLPLSIKGARLGSDSRRADVRWCVPACSGLYRAGIVFH